MLQTRRLDLVPATLELLQAELHDPADLATLLGVALPGDWPPGEYDREALVYFCARMEAGGAAVAGWYSWYGLARDPAGQREGLVAAAGFMGPPVAGCVEVGYSVIASARGRGFASEMVGALADHAFASGRVEQVLAQVAETNPASAKVLLACGFRRDGAGREPGTLCFRKRSPRK